MNGQSWLTLLGTLGIPTVIAAFISYVGVRGQLRSNAPKTTAEAEVARAEARARDIEAQGGIVARLSAENQRLDRANTSLSRRLDALEARFDEVSDHNSPLKRQIALLTESLTQFSDWANRYYHAGHPAGMQPPPTIKRFDSP